MTVIRRVRRRAGRGTLVIVTMLLIGSGLIRLGDDVGLALARIPAEAEISTAEETSQGCEPPEDLRGLMAALEERENRLTTREAALEERMQALSVAEETVTKRLAQLQQADAALRETIALAESASKQDLDRLTKVYENMKPQQAAALFEQMDPAFAAGFLGRMRPDAAAEIMAGLTPEAAHTFSVVLAGRNAEVPRE